MVVMLVGKEFELNLCELAQASGPPCRLVD